MNGYGWVHLHRNIRDNWVWQDKPFAYGQAWLDMIMMANHSDNKFQFGNEVVNVEKGTFITSELKLMNNWGWSKSKVRRFLKLLESDGMISKKVDRRKTTITILKYSVFNDLETNERPKKDYSKTNERPKKDTNKNVKNDKNDKENNISAFFEKIWKLYPNKKGKGQVSDAQKKRLYKIGFEEISQAIERYKAELEKDKDWRKPQNGSTFFNSGYVDYLDGNYTEKPQEESEQKPEYDMHYLDKTLRKAVEGGDPFGEDAPFK